MNNKKKILFVMNSLYGGGAEKVLQTLLCNMDYDKFDITLYSFHQVDIDYNLYPKEVNYKFVFPYSYDNSLLTHYLQTLYNKVKGKMFSLLPAKLFCKIFFSEKYDVEVAFIEGESTKLVSGSNNKKSRKIAWVHVDLLNNPWTDFLYNDVTDESNHYKKFDNILCVSNSVKDAFISKYNIDSRKVKTQYNPIDQNEIVNQSMEVVELEEKKVPRIIAVGRLVNQKGFDRLLRVVSKLKDDGYNFELLILGDGEKRTELENYIKDNGLSSKVKLLGFQSNPYAFMRKSDFLVCSSRAEGFSTVIAEAIIIGLPIISMECAGIYELFGNYNCGIITENNEDSFYDALKKVLNNLDLLNYYSSQSKERRKYFLIEKAIDDIESLFNEEKRRGVDETII